MVNAHLLAVSNASTSPVNASAAGCKNCQGSSQSKGSSEPGEAPSFATLLDTQTNAPPLEAQTNESRLLSDQQPAENDLKNTLIAVPPLPPEALPVALLALAANDVFPTDMLPTGEQAVTDDIASTPLKQDTLLGDLIAKPASPEGKNQPLPNFTENLDAVAGQIEPRTTTAPDNIEVPESQHIAERSNPAGATGASTIAPSDATIATGTPPIAPSDATTTTPIAPIVTGERATARNAIPPINPQTQTSPESPLVLNDNARSPAPFTNSVNEQVIAKTNVGTDDALLSRPTIETEAKAGNVAAKSNGDTAAAPQNAGSAQTNPRETAPFNTIAANKVPSNTGAPVIDAPAPVKIERNAPLVSTASTTPVLNAAPEGEARPASLMQRLKPLAQAAFSFQGMENAQNSAKAGDGMVPAISMTAIGDLARPSGITGLTPTINNPALPPVPLNNIAVHIASQANAGHQRFNIRLDPPELGRIDIRLEIGRDGQTMTHLAVEKPETLDLLRQDARTLERALNNAGLDSRNGSLSFSLKGENQDKQQAGSSQADGTSDTDENLSEQEGDEPVINRTLNMSSGLDISI